MLFVLFLQLLRFLGFWEWSFHGVSFGAFGLVKGMSLVFAFLDALMVSSVLLGAVFYVLFTRAWRPLVFSYELKDFDRMYPQSEDHPRWKGAQPPCFLNGWHLVGWVDDFEPGKTVKKVRLHSREFALFRAADGSFGLLEAFCPHMGADLTVLGSVEDCSLRCPFHHWEFNVAGQCTKIPYLKTGQSIPSAANAKSHKVRVFNKAVFTWWDAEGREPWFDIDDSAAPVMPPDYQLEGVVRYNLRCHVMDVKENLPDVAHLQHLHGEHSFYFLRWIAKFVDFRNKWDAEWEVHPTRPHMSIGKIINWIGPQKEPIVQAVHTIGPSLGVSEPLGGFVMQSTTVVDPHHVILEARFFGPSSWFRRLFYSKVVVNAYHNQTFQDVPVWCNKVYREKMVAVPGDGPIQAFRRWTIAQFTSASSPTFASLQEQKRARPEDMEW